MSLSITCIQFPLLCIASIPSNVSMLCILSMTCTDYILCAVPALNCLCSALFACSVLSPHFAEVSESHAVDDTGVNTPGGRAEARICLVGALSSDPQLLQAAQVRSGLLCSFYNTMGSWYYFGRLEHACNLICNFDIC